MRRHPGVLREIMPATSATAAAVPDQYPRLSFVGMRRARRSTPTAVSRRKEVKKGGRRRSATGGREGGGEKPKDSASLW